MKNKPQPVIVSAEEPQATPHGKLTRGERETRGSEGPRETFAYLEGKAQKLVTHIQELRKSEERPSELFFGLAAGIGTDRDAVKDALKNSLARAGYDLEILRLSDLMVDGLKADTSVAWKTRTDEVSEALEEHQKWSQSETRDRAWRIACLMNLGNALRRQCRSGDILARMSIEEVQFKREKRIEALCESIHHTNQHSVRSERDSTEDLPSLPKCRDNAQCKVPRVAYLFDSLKNPSEIETLRDVYGEQFHLLSVYTPREQRMDQLADSIAESRGGKRRDDCMDDAHYLAQRDDAEKEDKLGQNLQDTFANADLFVFLPGGSQRNLENQISRYIDLLFDDPFKTPTRDEYAMFVAKGSASITSTPPRQVGACITTYDGSVVATGTNEVPKAFGGIYWSGDNPDGRDHRSPNRIDPSDRMRAQALYGTFAKLDEENWIRPKMTNVEFKPDGRRRPYRQLIEYLTRPDQEFEEHLITLIAALFPDEKTQEQFDNIEQIRTQILEGAIKEIQKRIPEPTIQEILSKTVPDAKRTIDSSDVDLTALLREEKASKNRKSLIEYIETKIDVQPKHSPTKPTSEDHYNRRRRFAEPKRPKAFHWHHELIKQLQKLSEGQDVPKRYLEYLVTRLTTHILKGTTLLSLNEFTRTVHAEMVAITDAARRGTPVQGMTLYSTTFPCHECSRHILSSGIERVVYIQPYPKSYAKEHHPNSIQVDPDSIQSKDNRTSGYHVRYEPFVGIAPRRYDSVFSLENRQTRKGPGGDLIRWGISGSVPRFSSEAKQYIEKEMNIINQLNSWRRKQQ